MKPKEKEFCRLMAAYADPVRAAREAGYRRPERDWSELAAREEIVEEIRRRCENIRSVYESTATAGLYRLAYGDIGDALTLISREALTEDELRSLDLRNVSEIKRTDKGIEVKFCDRIKAIDKLQELFSRSDRGGGSGLLDAIMTSAKALSDRAGSDSDEF